MVHDDRVVDCPAWRGISDVSIDRCLACPVFEHHVDDETLAYVVCGIGTAAFVGEQAPLEAVSVRDGISRG